MTLKSDTERAIIALRNRVAAMCIAEVATEDAVKGDKESNGPIERPVMLLRGTIRTSRCHIESRTEEPISVDSPCHTMVGGARRMQSCPGARKVVTEGRHLKDGTARNRHKSLFRFGEKSAGKTNHHRSE